jgi:uncharacterized protein YqjF (DUF2071 family)
MTDRPFLTAAWRNLAVLNFEVDPSVLKAHLPAGTELDLWNGKALVSLVAFRFLNARIFNVPVPLHRDFEEINLRFYVRGPQGRGVVFIKEIVPLWSVATVANLFYGEKYVTADIDYSFGTFGALARLRYTWPCNGNANTIAVSFTAQPELPPEDSEEAFIFEHYWGYTRTKSGGMTAYKVDHPRWLTRRVDDSQHVIDGDSLYGSGFGEALRRSPVSVMFAEGSDVTVFRAIA